MDFLSTHVPLHPPPPRCLPAFKICLFVFVFTPLRHEVSAFTLHGHIYSIYIIPHGHSTSMSRRTFTLGFSAFFSLPSAVFLSFLRRLVTIIILLLPLYLWGLFTKYV